MLETVAGWARILAMGLLDALIIALWVAVAYNLVLLLWTCGATRLKQLFRHQRPIELEPPTNYVPGSWAWTAWQAFCYQVERPEHRSAGTILRIPDEGDYPDW